MLRELKNKDASMMAETLNDASVNRYMNIGEKATSVETCIDFINNSNKDEHNKHFAIVDKWSVIMESIIDCKILLIIIEY